MKANGKLAVLALSLAVALPATAATMNTDLLPTPKTENGITFLSGGIGKTEASAMKNEARHYPLSMVFSATKTNEYLADVLVTLKNEAGKKLLSAVSDGPIMLVKLPAGEYKVAAEINGKTLHRTVRVSGKGDRRLEFHWPQA
jgi:hypothetical protein